MDEVDKRLGALSRGIKRQLTRGDSVEKKILDSMDHSQREEVQQKGTAILGALRSQREKSSLSDEVDYHFLAGSVASYGSGRRPYLVNPFTLVHFPVSYYENLFGVDVDPECVIPILKIWRIEKFNPVEVPDSLWGQFHTRDAYLILWITDKDEKQVINIHHWIGKESTPDKFGSLAIRAIELNIRLGGQCRIYREEEGVESDLFVSYFDEDLEYLFGGTETAFKKVEELIWEPRLYHICRLVDRANPRKENDFYVQKVEMNADVLSHDDVYVLDTGKKLFQFNGKFSDSVHRHFGAQFCFQVNYYDHRGSATRIILEDDEILDSDESRYEWGVFWGCLGGQLDIPPSEKVVAFGLAVAASKVSVVGNWPIPVVEPLEEMEPEPQEESERELDDRLERNDERAQRNKEREERKRIFDNYQWNPETRETTMELTEQRPGIFSGKFLLPFGIFKYRYKIEKDREVEFRVDKKRATEKTITGDSFNRIHVSDQEIAEPIMYRIAVVDGAPDVEELDVDVLDLSKTLLNDAYVYILDCDSETFVWMGRRSKPAHRKVGMVLARRLMDDMERPPWGDKNPHVVFSGAEMPTFQYKFYDWNRSLRIFCRTFIPKSNDSTPMRAPPVLVEKLVTDICICERIGETDDLTCHCECEKCSGQSCPLAKWSEAAAEFSDTKAQVWVLNGRGPKLEKLTQSEGGQFHDGNCYMVLLTYCDKEDRNKQKFLAYFWEGVNSNGRSRWPEFLRGFYHPVLEKKVGVGRIRVERVFQFKEPPAFMSLFGGEIIIRSGKRSALRRKILRQKALFWASVVRPGLKHITQVNLTPAPLNRESCFVLQTEETMFVWIGSCAQKGEAERGRSFAEKFSNERPIVEEHEGSESQKFWDDLGGPTPVIPVPSDSLKKYFRLYRCSNDKGYFHVERIQDFCQSDLDHSSVFILDGYERVFLWIGNSTVDSLQDQSSSLVRDYVNEISRSREMKVETEVQEVGSESAMFRQFFSGWEKDALKLPWADSDPYERSKERIRQLRKEQVVAFLMTQKEAQQKVELERIRRQSEMGIKAEMIQVDFRRELLQVDIQLPDPKELSKLEAEERNKTQRKGWSNFCYHVKRSDSIPALVLLLGSWNNFEPVSMVLSQTRPTDEEYLCSYNFSIDLPVGRYWYYYKVAYEDAGLVPDVDQERNVAMRDDIQMNNIRVRAADRINGEEEQIAWDEKDKKKIEEALSLEPKFEEDKVEVEEEEKKEEKTALTDEADVLLSKEVEERLAARRRKKEEEKEKLNQERKERITQMEIEAKVANRRGDKGGDSSGPRSSRRRGVSPSPDSSSLSDRSRQRETDETSDTLTTRRARVSAQETDDTEDYLSARRRRRAQNASETTTNEGEEDDSSSRRRRRRQESSESGDTSSSSRSPRVAKEKEEEVDVSSMSLEERIEYRRKRRQNREL